tara:strand:+ start:535 stop:1074 length:540 start_codon:yes stop_codon:yes gene_type:complete
MRDITAYYWFKEAFSKEEIKKVYELAKEYPEQEATTFGADDDYRRSKISWMGLDDKTGWIYQKLINCMAEANNEEFGFDWTGATEAIQFTTYDAGDKGHYDWHMDVIPSNQNRKISAVVLLNDDYEGGNLQIEGKDLTETVGAGNVIIFPSYLLHKVEEVTKGTRNSLVIWGVGQEAFK